MPVDRSPVPSPTGVPAPTTVVASPGPPGPESRATPFLDPVALRALESLHGDGADA
jgi:hypothetical protein